MPCKVIIDTDPGVDDAMALLLALASPELEVTGVTTVYGNHEVEQTTRNVLYVLDIARRADIPVVAGAAAPLQRPYRGKRSAIHGADGLGNVQDRPGGRQPTEWPGRAAGYIVDSALAQPGELTLITLGPLTNLTLALGRELRLAPAIRQVIVMGGAVHCPGNATPVAEANVLNDPEAAAAVLGAPWPVTLVGLDVTMQTLMDEQYLHNLAQAGTMEAEFIGQIVPVYLQSYRHRYGLNAIPTHDPSAVMFAIDPSLFRVQRERVYVETEGRCAGQVVADPRGLWTDLPEIDVCVEVDSARLLEMFRERLSH